jgi:hypothetical protein
VLTSIVESWNALYANHATLRTAIEFTHIAGLAAGGGCAVVADLTAIAAPRGGPASAAARLQLLEQTHRIVLLGLVALTVSGVLLFAADVDTYLYSRIFWLKMGFMALLVTNGARLLVVERRAASGDARAWASLRKTATVSLVLWSATTLAGAALTNIG